MERARGNPGPQLAVQLRGKAWSQLDIYLKIQSPFWLHWVPLWSNTLFVKLRMSFKYACGMQMTLLNKLAKFYENKFMIVDRIRAKKFLAIFKIVWARSLWKTSEHKETLSIVIYIYLHVKNFVNLRWNCQCILTIRSERMLAE